MKLDTHLEIDNSLCGKVVDLKDGFAKVQLTTTHSMRADSRGLVHGSFAFGAADLCAMAVINDPNVVLAGCDSKFMAPVKVSQTMVFEGCILESNGKKASVKVIGFVDEKKIFEAVFKIVTLKKHIFDL
jgi:acyl-coenzyme A thioesterase PaaI-like protein